MRLKRGKNMQKTKIGISAGCFGAVIYLAGVTGGLLLAAILIGYVLLLSLIHI